MDTQTADTTQQVTSQIARPIVKNPKRVATGKAVAEKTRQVREAHKQKLAEADEIMANEGLSKAQEEARKAKEAVDSPVENVVPPVVPPVETPVEAPTLTTTQWLSVASIIVSLAAIYYKREEIKGTIAKIKVPAKAPAKEPVLTAPKKNGIRSMD